MDFGWKKKAEILKTTLVSAGHQMAKELPPVIVQTLDMFRRAAQSGDASGMLEEIASVERTAPGIGDGEKLLWEPAEIYGWNLQAAFYKKDDALWWLVRAVRRNERIPAAKDLAILAKVLAHLGATHEDAIIAAGWSPAGEEPLPFGWWTWRNVSPLYEMQVNKTKRGAAAMRIVRLGTPPSDGYECVDLTGGAP